MRNPFAQRIGKNIHRLAKKRRWALERVALEAGLSRSHFFYVMSGTRSPSMLTIQKIAEALRVDALELWKR